MVDTPMNMFSRRVLDLASRLRSGRLAITLPGGPSHTFEGAEAGPSAEIEIFRPDVGRKLLFGGDLGLAEAYMDGDWDTPDLAAFLELGARNADALGASLTGSLPYRLVQRAIHALRPNSRRGSRRNIAAHYDLGNEFYACWLDPTMTYSSAIFASPDQPLEAAQENKYAHIAATAQIRPGMDVLEIGCGWGGFAEHAGANGCFVRAITISDAQLEFARERIGRAGLDQRVTVEHRDYRHVEGTFDAIVSIEMIEAVGERYWPSYFGRVAESLRPGGTAAIQAIVMADQFWDGYRRSVDFIQRYVFPGGMLPSRSSIAEHARAAGLTVTGDTGYGIHYARTLAIWNQRFQRAWPALTAMGFDERFRRLWTYYLAYCEAGFRTGRIDVRQVALRRT